MYTTPAPSIFFFINTPPCIYIHTCMYDVHPRVRRTRFRGVVQPGRFFTRVTDETPWEWLTRYIQDHSYEPRLAPIRVMRARMISVTTARVGFSPSLVCGTTTTTFVSRLVDPCAPCARDTHNVHDATRNARIRVDTRACGEQ